LCNTSPVLTHVKRWRRREADVLHNYVPCTPADNWLLKVWFRGV
jgi:hypothetical protein